MPPRVVLLLDAPTNALIAGYFATKGYSVEIVMDLKYCQTPLLKSARYIVLNENIAKSPYYDNIRATLKKLVPDRLFEAVGHELIRAVREKVTTPVQITARHPQDGPLEVASRNQEEQKALAELPTPASAEKVQERRKVNYSGPRRSEEPEIVESEEENALAKEGGDAGGGGGGASDMQRKMQEEATQMLADALKKSGSRQSQFELTDEIRGALSPYVETSGHLRQIHVERESLLASELPEDSAAELRKQSSLINKPQMPEIVIQRAKETEEKVKAAKAAGKEFPPRKLPAGELNDQILEMGRHQDELLLKKAMLRFDLAYFFADKVVNDTLYKILRSTGVDADYLYGTIYFTLALEGYREEVFKRQQNLQKQVEAFAGHDNATSKGGSFSLFGKKKTENLEQTSLTPEQQQRKQEAATLGYAVLQIDQDLTSMEPDLVGSYWAVYEQVILLLLEGSVKNKAFLRRIRAFLRFGLISDHPALISDAQRNSLLEKCDDDCSDFAHQGGRTNIVYPDELLLQIRDGIIPPSFNEELELTGQGTPEYKYDKVLRKIYSSKFKIEIFNRELGLWSGKVQKQNDAITASEKMLTEAEKGSKEHKALLVAVRESKTEIARLTKIVEKLTTTIDTEKENLSAGQETLKGLGVKLSLKDLAQKETASLRKFCKLLGNRKEPFFPFVLRDNYQPDINNLYTRTILAQEIAKLEAADSSIFSADLVNAQNPRKRVMIRYSPTLVALPCLGIIGFSITPSSSTDTGRLVLPMMSPSQSPLPKMIVEMFSDFRYDTSKLSGGMDWMTSDTIVAAYAKVRWDYRKKSKEFREKAAIYNDLPDRKNFKFHYALYINSMDESGKKLFFKCAEMYESFTKYIPLPEGKEKLKRA